MSQLPPGFVLDQTPQQSAGLPQGFVLDQGPGFDQMWGDTDKSVPLQQNVKTQLDPEIDRILAREAPNNRGARVEQHIRNLESKSLDATPDIAMQGLTYGLSDELGAGLQYLTGQGDYDELLDATRQRIARVKSDQPVASAVVEIGGALANPLSRLGWAAQGATRGERLVKGALEGGALSGVYGFNQGEGGLENRVNQGALSAGIGAAIGGPLNAVLPAVRGPVSSTAGSQVAEAAERLGVNLPRAVTSDSRAVQQIGKAVTNVPVAGLPLRNASERAIGQLDEAAANVQRGFGQSNPAQAGQVAKEGLENYIGPVTSARARTLYDKVDNLVDNTITSPLTNTQAIAQNIIARRQNAGIAQESDAVKRITAAISRPEGLNYNGVKDLRSWIGETLDSGILPADLSKAELKQIYGALTKDLQFSVQNAGSPQALAAFQRANKYYELVSARRENLNRILGAKSEEGVFERIMAAATNSGRADQVLLAQARKALPADEWNEIASAVIARMGRDPSYVTTPGTSVTATGFSPDRFMTAYGKLSPAGKSLLFRSTGQSQLANALDDIATVSQRFKQLNTFANPSGTGQQITSVIGGAGLITDPITTLTTIASGAVVSQLLSRPQSAQSIAKWSNAYYNAVARPTRATLQAFNQASRTFADDIGRQLNAPQHAESLFRQLQGTIPVRAQDEQRQ